MESKPLAPETLAIHAGQEPDPATGALMPPIVTSSTFAQRAPGDPIGFEYARLDNPTRRALERCVAALEGGADAAAFGSGSAAVHAVLQILASDERVVAGNDIYGGTFRLLGHEARHAGIEVTQVDVCDLAAVREAIGDRTRLVWIEIPSNPLLRVPDVAAVAEAAHARGALLAVDSTFATPMLIRPLEHGADLVVHSSSKYLGGHSDVIGGLVVTRDPELGQRIRWVQKSVGAIPSAFDCYLVVRGIKTLALRVARHGENAATLAAWLERHPRIARVHYPGLASSPHRALAERQLRGFGGVVTFVIDGGEAEARRVLGRLRLFTVAESLGGVESLIGHPASMSHAAVPREQRLRLGIEDGLVRASVGVEAASDLVADLEAALA